MYIFDDLTTLDERLHQKLFDPLISRHSEAFGCLLDPQRPGMGDPRLRNPILSRVRNHLSLSFDVTKHTTYHTVLLRHAWHSGNDLQLYWAGVRVEFHQGCMLLRHQALTMSRHGLAY
jgi:hypothetical protein